MVIVLLDSVDWKYQVGIIYRIGCDSNKPDCAVRSSGFSISTAYRIVELTGLEIGLL